MISLAGGLPHPSLFPLHSLAICAYPSSTVLDPTSGAPPEAALDFVVPRTRKPSSDVTYDLSSGLQYTGGEGLAPLADFCRDLTTRLWKPAYADWDVLLHGGGTDAWTKVLTLLLERGEYVLTESQVYPSAQAAFAPLGVRAVPVPDDAEGMRADALEAALATWDEARGPRPRVMYLVPVGQNPLGTTMGAERRQAIYDVCVKYGEWSWPCPRGATLTVQTSSLSKMTPTPCSSSSLTSSAQTPSPPLL
jgi:aromatic amino acid aminotransferase I